MGITFLRIRESLLENRYKYPNLLPALPAGHADGTAFFEEISFLQVPSTFLKGPPVGLFGFQGSSFSGTHVFRVINSRKFLN